LYGTYIPGERLILTVKIETRHRIEGPSGREFPTICNLTVFQISSKLFTFGGVTAERVKTAFAVEYVHRCLEL